MKASQIKCLPRSSVFRALKKLTASGKIEKDGNFYRVLVEEISEIEELRLKVSKMRLEIDELKRLLEEKSQSSLKNETDSPKKVSKMRLTVPKKSQNLDFSPPQPENKESSNINDLESPYIKIEDTTLLLNDKLVSNCNISSNERGGMGGKTIAERIKFFDKILFEKLKIHITHTSAQGETQRFFKENQDDEIIMKALDRYVEFYAVAKEHGYVYVYGRYWSTFAFKCWHIWSSETEYRDLIKKITGQRAGKVNDLWKDDREKSKKLMSDFVEEV